MNSKKISQVSLKRRDIASYRETEFSDSNEVYAIYSKKDIEQIGILFLSEAPEGIYIDWIELFAPFRSHGFLRNIFAEIHATHPKAIYLESNEDHLKKYLAIGCKVVGTDEIREMWSLEYILDNADGKEKKRKPAAEDSGEISYEEKKKILNPILSIQNDTDFKKELEAMCNISYGIAEKNYKKGLSEEKTKTIQRMLQRNMPIEDIKFYTNATEEEIKKAKEEICVK